MVFDRLPRVSLCHLPTPLEEMPALARALGGPRLFIKRDDPVYTGKAMAGLIDLVRTGVFTAGQTVVFIHTGGTSGLFGYRDGLAEDVR